MKKVSIIWVIVPVVLCLVLGFLYIDRLTYINNTVKPYVNEQNTALNAYVGALDEANFRVTYNGTYTLEQLKLVVSNDPAQQKEGFTNLVNFQAKQAVTPPTVPEIKQL